MNQSFELDKQGGFPLTQNALAHMQDGYSQSIGALTALAGNLVILSGCEDANGLLGDGWVIIMGEVLPFRKSAKQSHIVVTTEREELTYETGVKHLSKVTRYAQFGSAGAEKYPFASFVRVDNLVSLRKLVNDVQSELNQSIGQTQQTLTNSINQVQANLTNYVNTNPQKITWNEVFYGTSNLALNLKIFKGTNGVNEFRKFEMTFKSYTASGTFLAVSDRDSFFLQNQDLSFVTSIGRSMVNKYNLTLSGNVSYRPSGIAQGWYFYIMLSEANPTFNGGTTKTVITQIS
jgi:hypothetical protein